MEVVDKEHVEDKILDGGGRFLPSNDVIISLLQPADGASFRKKMLDSIDIMKKLGSFKLWLGNFIQQLFLVLKHRACCLSSRVNVIQLQMNLWTVSIRRLPKYRQTIFKRLFRAPQC